MHVKGNVVETLTDDMLSRLFLPNKEQAFFNVHDPINLSLLERAQKRLKFEELLFLQFHLSK